MFTPRGEGEGEAHSDDENEGETKSLTDAVLGTYNIM